MILILILAHLMVLGARYCTGLISYYLYIIGHLLGGFTLCLIWLVSERGIPYDDGFFVILPYWSIIP